MKQQEQELFIEFLKSTRVEGKRVYRRFIKNLYADEKISLEDYTASEIDPEPIIRRAFYWRTAAEGPEFWVEVDIKWQKYLERHGY